MLESTMWKGSVTDMTCSADTATKIPKSRFGVEEETELRKPVRLLLG